MGANNQNASSVTGAGSSSLFGITKERLRRSTGSGQPDVQIELAMSVAFALPSIAGRNPDNWEASVRATLAMLEEIAPRDTLEGMLAVQMVSVHNTMLECFRRALVANQPAQIVDMNLRQAAKLASVFERQLSTLDKRRGKGQQTIRVEHVNSQIGLPKAKVSPPVKALRKAPEGLPKPRKRARATLAGSPHISAAQTVALEDPEDCREVVRA